MSVAQDVRDQGVGHSVESDPLQPIPGLRHRHHLLELREAQGRRLPSGAHCGCSQLRILDFGRLACGMNFKTTTKSQCVVEFVFGLSLSPFVSRAASIDKVDLRSFPWWATWPTSGWGTCWKLLFVWTTG